jgi:hypothetical protein
VSESDIYLYAGITGDFKPADVNDAYAQSTFFKTRIAHGMLTAGFLSTVIVNPLPGPAGATVRPLNRPKKLKTARVLLVENKERRRIQTNKIMLYFIRAETIHQVAKHY